MPSLVTLPLIQCHQTRGLALAGGSWKPLARASLAVWANEVPDARRAPIRAAKMKGMVFSAC